MSLLRRSSWTPPPPPDEVAAAAAEINEKHAAQAAADVATEKCPDGEICARGCVAGCWRVDNADAAPAAGSVADDPTPDELETEAAAANAAEAARLLEDGDRAAAEEVDGELVPTKPKVTRPRKPPAAEIIMHPRTGEAIEIVAATPTDRLAELRAAIIDWDRDVVAGWKRTIDDEIRDRLDRENTRSATVGRAGSTAGKWKVTVPAPTTTEWDGEAAYKAVRELVRQGLISQDAAGRSVERVVDYKPKHAELKKLADHADERVRAAVRACRTINDVDPKDRRVSVSPVRTGRSDRDDT